MAEKPKLFVMCGMSGSGKTTFAKRFCETRELRYLNPDQFYELFNGDERNHSNEFDVWMAVYRALHIAEQEKVDTILDTNCPSFSGRNQLIEFFPDFDHHLIVIQADLDLCLKNNARRYRQIPESEMRRMWTAFQYPEISEWKYWKSMIWYRNMNNKGFQQMHMIRHI